MLDNWSWPFIDRMYKRLHAEQPKQPAPDSVPDITVTTNNPLGVGTDHSDSEPLSPSPVVIYKSEKTFVPIKTVSVRAALELDAAPIWEAEAGRSTAAAASSSW